MSQVEARHLPDEQIVAEAPLRVQVRPHVPQLLTSEVTSRQKL